MQRLRQQTEALLDENAAAQEGLSGWHHFVHFWLLVWRSFVRNRCPIRASALAYASLLALIPMLAVVMSVSSTFLKKEGEDRIDQLIGKLVATMTPPATLSTNSPAGDSADSTTTAANTNVSKTASVTSTNSSGAAAAASTNSAAGIRPGSVEKPGERPESASAAEAGTGLDGFATDEKTLAARKAAARKINEFIQNTRSGALGVTGSVLLIFAAISMLSRIEATFNDIWGVPRGRSWFMRIVLYWGVLSLAPLLLILALGLATGPHLQATQRLVAGLPLIGTFLVSFGFQLLPVAVLCLTFAAFYMLMPNTKVHWGAALVGGLVGGLLFHLNNLFSVLYVYRVVYNSAIYGSLGLIPVIMIGLYFSWLILLFGGQVAYAFQNRRSYAEEKQIEMVNQRGREFIALRLMTRVAQRYLQGEPPCSIAELSEELAVPTRLVRQIMETLAAARLVVETAGAETAYLPARPMEGITCHDILLALRATQGQELATRDEPTRTEVYGEFQRIQEAERQAASSVTMLALAHRAQQQVEQTQLKALT